MDTVIVIPARKGSTRFPNKPLAVVLGQQLLYRTWRIARAVRQVDEVFVATDNEEIGAKALGFGAKVIVTRPGCENGTIRVFEAVEQLMDKPRRVVNLQGDAILTPHWVIEAVINEMRKDASIPWATPAVQLDWKRYDEFVRSKSEGRVGGTLVVFDKNKNALYFSKGMIPFVRDRSMVEPPIYRHIGLYCYSYDALSAYSRLKPTPLEETEKLEQLRAIENGIPIRVVPVDYRGRTHWSIDNPEDVKVAEEIILREGELIP